MEKIEYKEKVELQSILLHFLLLPFYFLL